MSSPRRIQLRRTKGWRMPPNTVKVARPGKLGNPFIIRNAIEMGYASSREDAQRVVVECFRDWIRGGDMWWTGPESAARRKAILDALLTLSGKNLACWCAPGQPCHADVLLELANRERSER